MFMILFAFLASSLLSGHLSLHLTPSAFSFLCQLREELSARMAEWTMAGKRGRRGAEPKLYNQSLSTLSSLYAHLVSLQHLVVCTASFERYMSAQEETRMEGRRREREHRMAIAIAQAQSQAPLSTSSPPSSLPSSSSLSSSHLNEESNWWRNSPEPEQPAVVYTLDFSLFPCLHKLELRTLPPPSTLHLLSFTKLQFSLRQLVLREWKGSIEQLMFPSLAITPGLSTPLEHWNLQYLSIRHSSSPTLLTCLRHLPALELFDAPWCNLEELPALPNASLLYIDAGFNSLHSVHHLSDRIGNVSTLILRANQLADLMGIEKLLAIEKLDVSYNLITAFTQLLPLQSLPLLQSLWLFGNPISLSPVYRTAVLCILRRKCEAAWPVHMPVQITQPVPPSSQPSEPFYLDDISVSRDELELIRQLYADGIEGEVELMGEQEQGHEEEEQKQQEQSKTATSGTSSSISFPHLTRRLAAAQRTIQKRKARTRIAAIAASESQITIGSGESSVLGLMSSRASSALPSPCVSVSASPTSEMLLQQEQKEEKTVDNTQNANTVTVSNDISSSPPLPSPSTPSSALLSSTSSASYLAHLEQLRAQGGSSWLALLRAEQPVVEEEEMRDERVRTHDQTSFSTRRLRLLASQRRARAIRTAREKREKERMEREKRQGEEKRMEGQGESKVDSPSTDWSQFLLQAGLSNCPTLTRLQLGWMLSHTYEAIVTRREEDSGKTEARSSVLLLYHSPFLREFPLSPPPDPPQQSWWAIAQAQQQQLIVCVWLADCQMMVEQENLSTQPLLSHPPSLQPIPSLTHAPSLHSSSSAISRTPSLSHAQSSLVHASSLSRTPPLHAHTPPPVPFPTPSSPSSLSSDTISLPVTACVKYECSSMAQADELCTLMNGGQMTVESIPTSKSNPTVDDTNSPLSSSAPVLSPASAIPSSPAPRFLLCTASAAAWQPGAPLFAIIPAGYRIHPTSSMPSLSQLAYDASIQLGETIGGESIQPEMMGQSNELTIPTPAPPPLAIDASSTVPIPPPTPTHPRLKQIYERYMTGSPQAQGLQLMEKRKDKEKERPHSNTHSPRSTPPLSVLSDTERSLDGYTADTSLNAPPAGIAVGSPGKRRGLAKWLEKEKEKEKTAQAHAQAHASPSTPSSSPSSSTVLPSLFPTSAAGLAAAHPAPNVNVIATYISGDPCTDFYALLLTGHAPAHAAFVAHWGICALRHPCSKWEAQAQQQQQDGAASNSTRSTAAPLSPSISSSSSPYVPAYLVLSGSQLLLLESKENEQQRQQRKMHQQRGTSSPPPSSLPPLPPTPSSSVSSSSPKSRHVTSASIGGAASAARPVASTGTKTRTRHHSTLLSSSVPNTPASPSPDPLCRRLDLDFSEAESGSSATDGEDERDQTPQQMPEATSLPSGRIRSSKSVSVKAGTQGTASVATADNASSVVAASNSSGNSKKVFALSSSLVLTSGLPSSPSASSASASSLLGMLRSIEEKGARPGRSPSPLRWALKKAKQQRDVRGWSEQQLYAAIDREVAGIEPTQQQLPVTEQVNVEAHYTPDTVPLVVLIKEPFVHLARVVLGLAMQYIRLEFYNGNCLFLLTGSKHRTARICERLQQLHQAQTGQPLLIEDEDVLSIHKIGMDVFRLSDETASMRLYETVQLDKLDLPPVSSYESAAPTPAPAPSATFRGVGSFFQQLTGSSANVPAVPAHSPALPLHLAGTMCVLVVSEQLIYVCEELMLFTHMLDAHASVRAKQAKHSKNADLGSLLHTWQASCVQSHTVTNSFRAGKSTAAKQNKSHAHKQHICRFRVMAMEALHQLSHIDVLPSSSSSSDDASPFSHSLVLSFGKRSSIFHQPRTQGANHSGIRQWHVRYVSIIEMRYCYAVTGIVL